MAKKGLGKGLSTLFDDNTIIDDIIEESSNKDISQIKLSLIEPNRNQPRKNFDEDALLELSESIKQHGIIQPLVVRKLGDKFEIIAG